MIVAPVEKIGPELDVQLKGAEPLAVSVAVCPLHILGEFTVTIGLGFTVTVATAVPVQPFVVPVTV